MSTVKQKNILVDKINNKNILTNDKQYIKIEI